MASAPSSHIAQVGDFELTLVRDSVYWWDGGAIFGVVPKTLWSRKTAADELNRVPLGFNCYVIRTGDHTILIDTGGGDKMDARGRERAKLPPVPEPLPEVIARHGIDPESHRYRDQQPPALGPLQRQYGAHPQRARCRPFRARSISPAAANGSTPTSATCATVWPTSTPTTIR